MRQLLITPLLVFTLLSQWSWVEHAYHEHEEGKICELCINASGNAALKSTKPVLVDNRATDVIFISEFDLSIATEARFYSPRARPAFSNPYIKTI